MKFPTVYARQKAFYSEEWKKGLKAVAVKERELVKEVSKVYYQLVYLKEKQKLLEHTDSLMLAFHQVAQLRLKVGETNVLETATSETQRGAIIVQLRELKEDIELLQLRLKWLLNTSTNYIPSVAAYKISGVTITDTSMLKEHPYLQQLKQEQSVSQARVAVEKSKLSPDLLLGYNTMTIRGAGAEVANGQKVQASLRLDLAERGASAQIERHDGTGAEKGLDGTATGEARV